MSKQTAAYNERKAWRDFLIHIYIDHIDDDTDDTPPLKKVLRILYRILPPTKYIHTDADRWEYLRQIAAGFVLVPGCGLVCRGELAQFLRENDPENIQ